MLSPVRIAAGCWRRGGGVVPACRQESSRRLTGPHTARDQRRDAPSDGGRLEGVELEEGNAYDNFINMRTEVHCRTCKGHLVGGGAAAARRRTRAQRLPACGCARGAREW